MALCWMACNGRTALLGVDSWQPYMCIFLANQWFCSKVGNLLCVRLSAQCYASTGIARGRGKAVSFEGSLTSVQETPPVWSHSRHRSKMETFTGIAPKDRGKGCLHTAVRAGSFQNLVLCTPSICATTVNVSRQTILHLLGTWNSTLHFCG